MAGEFLRITLETQQREHHHLALMKCVAAELLISSSFVFLFLSSRPRKLFERRIFGVLSQVSCFQRTKDETSKYHMHRTLACASGHRAFDTNKLLKILPSFIRVEFAVGLLTQIGQLVRDVCWAASCATLELKEQRVNVATLFAKPKFARGKIR